MQQLSEQAAQRFTLLADAAGNAQQQLDAYIDAALALGAGSNPEAVTAWVIIGAEAVRIEEVRALYQQIIASTASSSANYYSRRRQRMA